jgi:hypothetical protein
MAFAAEREAIESRFCRLFHTEAPTYVSSLTLNLVNGVITRSAGSFLTDGIEVGNFIMFGGFSNASNNEAFEVQAVTDSTVTLKDPNGWLVNENGTGDESYSYPSYPVAYENSGFNPPDADKTYVTCIEVRGAASQKTIGKDNPWFQYLGFIQNSIYAPEGSGTATTMALADRIAKIWRNAQFAVGGGQITCGTPSLAPISRRALQRLGSRDGRFRMDVTTDYRLDTQET